MPIPRYGVWKGIATKWAPHAKPGHGHITFSDGKSNNLDCAVNIESKSAESRLVYWFNRDMDKNHRIIRLLDGVNAGFHPGEGAGSLAIDFFRDSLVDPKLGLLLTDDAPGPNNDILDFLNPVLNQAVAEKADIHLFGQQYDDRTGIHDIHMNQGNSDVKDPVTGKINRFSKDNGVYQDGAIIMRFPDGHWEGIFLAFAVQAYETDDEGMPAGPTFADLLGKLVPPIDGGGDDDGDTGGDGGGDGEDTDAPPAVAIQAAMVNPVGPDDRPTSGEGEKVYLVNRSAAPVSLGNWSIGNGQGQTYRLPRDASLVAHGRKGFAVPGCPLSNKGGRILLQDAKGKLVHSVRYTKEQAKREGVLITTGQDALALRGSIDD